MTTAVRERPIIFTGDNPWKIQNDLKSMTRRKIKFPKGKEDFNASWLGWHDHYEYGPGWYAQSVDQPYGEFSEMWDDVKLTCPYGAVGDVIYVKEPWRTSFVSDDTKPSLLFEGADQIWYFNRGNWSDRLGSYCRDGMGKVRSPIFMPFWASRLHLEITEIKAERIQSISHEDALAEGCTGYNWVASSPYIVGPHTDDGELPVEEFERLWNSIHGPKSWARNDWVWSLRFKRIA